MSPVRIIDESYVGLPAGLALPAEPIKLTAMEVLWVIVPLLQHVLLFEGADMPPLDKILQSLRSSLASTLVSFAPLAGKLIHLKDTDDIAISCAASDGVKLVVAESDDVDIRRLSGEEEHDMSVLQRLVPEVDMSELPTPVLAVQVTRFQDGVAVGMTVHHAVADGRSLWNFVEAWATACRGERFRGNPTFDRSLIKLPGGEDVARSISRQLLPYLRSPSPCMGEFKHGRGCRRTFTLDVQDLERLKQRIGTPRPSAFVAAAALTWTCFARCMAFALDDDLVLFFFADARGRLSPPVDAGYMGVCLTGCLAKLPARQLHDQHGLAVAASAVQDEIRKMTQDPLAGWNYMQQKRQHMATVPLERMLNVSGSTGFRAYQVADFGWGKPRRTEPIKMDHHGQVALMRATDGLGVQLSVSLLHPAHMDEFKSHFLHLIG